VTVARRIDYRPVKSRPAGGLPRNASGILNGENKSCARPKEMRAASCGLGDFRLSQAYRQRNAADR
jgi:hypothetical protein